MALYEEGSSESSDNAKIPRCGFDVTGDSNPMVKRLPLVSLVLEAVTELATRRVAPVRALSMAVSMLLAVLEVGSQKYNCFS